MKFTARALFHFAFPVVLALSILAAPAVAAQNQDNDHDSAHNHALLSPNAPSGAYHEAVIQIVFSGETDAEHPLTVADLNSFTPAIHAFFSDLSYTKLSLTTTYIRVHLPTTFASYGICFRCAPNSLMQDAINAALALDPSFFDDANGVSILILPTYGESDYTDFDLNSYSGISQQVTESVLSEDTPNPVWGGWSHEFGHQLEYVGGTQTSGQWLGHPSGYNSGYDLMDSCYPCGESSYGLLGKPFVTDARTVFPGWLDAKHVAVVPIPSGPAGQTFVLPPLTQNVTTPVVQAVEIPIDAQRSYWVNVRERVAADTFQNGVGIHSAGVQIQYTDVNAVFPVTVCRPFESPTCIDKNTDPPNWPYLMWPAGSTFTDASNSITIEVIKAVSGGFEVTVNRDVPPNHPDLFITPWLTPPENTYETVDIWVDSVCNGYGVLRYGKRSDGTVIGSGDDPCVNHENRVYATIHNIGSAAAGSTTAQFQVSNPLGVGMTGSWTSLGKATVPAIPAGGSATVFVTWTPTPTLTEAEIMAMHFSFHSCIQVIVAPVAGELVTTNNSAQENIGYFEAVAQGTAVSGNYNFPVLHSNFPITNSFPGNSQQYSMRTLSHLPAGWTFKVNGGVRDIQISTGTTTPIPVVITPAPSPVGKTYDLRADALTILTLQNHGSAHPSWFNAGGVDLNAHTVLPSAINVAGSVSPPGNTAPTVDVRGALNPAVAGAVVTIDLYSSAGGNFSAQLTVAASGKYSGTFQPGFFPTNVRVIWQGNMMYESAVATANVSTQSATTTALTSSLNPSTVNANVTFTATVTALGSGVTSPTGTVTFMDGATTLGSVAVSGGKAAFSTSTLAVGSHSITAVYSGDFKNFTSTSATLTQVVNGT
jgi:Bacterial Ig-like domain (group 3)/CARDB